MTQEWTMVQGTSMKQVWITVLMAVAGLLFAAACVMLPYVTGMDVQPPPPAPPAVMAEQPTPPTKVFTKASVTVPPGRVYDLKAAIPDGVNYAWAVPEQPGIDFRSSGASGFLFPQNAGTYFVGLAYGNPIQVAWVTVVVSGSANLPTPGPQPVPPPSPPPPSKTGPLTLIVVYDKIPVLPPFSGAMPLTDAMLAKGHQWKLIDRSGKDSRGAMVADPGKLPAAFKAGPPYLIVADNEGVISLQPLPTTQEEMLKILFAAEKQ